MKSIRFAVALFAAMTFCLSAGCSGDSSSTEREKTQSTTASSTEIQVDEKEAEAVATAEASENTDEWAYSLTAKNTDQLDISKLPAFNLSSDDLHDGVWDSDITNTKNGTNRSPQLSWEAVEGASCYAVYMIDTGTTGAGSWMHWKSLTEETNLPAGWASDEEYIGPYPPEGTHVYEILVFAMKQQPEKLKGAFDDTNEKLLVAFKVMDGQDGGNILACGHIKGTYTYGE